MIKSIYLFYVFKFAPKIIDSNASKFWRKNVALLNAQREKSVGAFYLWRVWMICVRDPYSNPVKSRWTSSNRHPFCWKLK